MARSFTEQERQNIEARLLTECEQSWSKFGYKKTNVDELCAKAGISKGAFYLFFESKEALFCKTLCMVQDRLYAQADEIMQKKSNKYGLAEALKVVYREYDKNTFVCNKTCSDFVSFTNKLTKEQLEEITQSGIRSGALFLEAPFLKPRVEKEMVASVLSALLSTISLKDSLPCSHIDTFDYMLDEMVETLFE